jgi:hypothetical protein
VPKALVIANTALSIAVTACKVCLRAYSLVENIRNALKKQIQRPTNNVHGLFHILGLFWAALRQENVASARLPLQMILGFGVLASALYKPSCVLISMLDSFVGAA